MALTWQHEQMTKSRALVRQKVLESNAVKVELNRYLQSLNLQGQVNAGRINEQQAMQMFQTAIQNFHQNLVNTVTKQFNPVNLPPDQTDLSKPLNMQSALANPNSFASQQADDCVAAMVVVAQAMMEEAQMMQNMQAADNENQNMQPQPQSNQNSDDEEESEKKGSFANTAENIGKDALEATAAIDVVKAIDSGDTAGVLDKMDKAYDKVTGMKSKFEDLFKGSEEGPSKSSLPTPKPSSRIIEKKDD